MFVVKIVKLTRIAGILYCWNKNKRNKFFLKYYSRWACIGNIIFVRFPFEFIQNQQLRFARIRFCRYISVIIHITSISNSFRLIMLIYDIVSIWLNNFQKDYTNEETKFSKWFYLENLERRQRKIVQGLIEKLTWTPKSIKYSY